MGPKTFRVALVLLALLVLISATPFPGALIGFACGVAVAFFVAGPSELAAALLRQAGLAATAAHVVWLLVGLYGLAIIAKIRAAVRAWRVDGPDAGRAAAIGAAFLAVLPLIAWLSSQALVKAWRY